MWILARGILKTLRREYNKEFEAQRFGIGGRSDLVGPIKSRDQKKQIHTIASMKGLECSKRAENIINRKVSIFYIETVLNFFFQLRKIIFVRSVEKKS